MKEARGKIVLIRRFKLTQNYEAWQTRAMGLDLTNWDDVSYRDYKYAYETRSHPLPTPLNRSL